MGLIYLHSVMHKKIPLVKAGDDIKARSFNDIIRVVNELSQVGNLTKNGSRRRAYLQPFGVNLFETAGSSPVTYYVTVNDGRVCELKRTALAAQDAIVLHEANNRLTTGDPTKFAMEVGDAIYVFVPEDSDGGVVFGDVAITVDDPAKVSTNYIPFTTSPQAGEYYYKLAELVEIDGVPRLKPFLSGSNIWHETGLSCDMVIKQCEGPGGTLPEVQALRVRFSSGRVAALNEAEEDVSYNTNLADVGVPEICT